jgi:hypothetical protein
MLAGSVNGERSKRQRKHYQMLMFISFCLGLRNSALAAVFFNQPAADIANAGTACDFDLERFPKR